MSSADRAFDFTTGKHAGTFATAAQYLGGLRELSPSCSFVPFVVKIETLPAFPHIAGQEVHNVCVAANQTIRRLKTYAGSQGYVYQYYFVGKRAALPDDPAAPATEFIFDVSSDRKLTYAVSVFLQEDAVKKWTAAHGRALNEAEQYAAAKLRLFRAFDELEDVKSNGRRLLVDGSLLEESLSGLGVE